ncbi:cilia- and flagella-associated protein 61 [Brachionichthys hirsutus]|uniref:cilia- and flagella-associated protein 61 n=1 Tax=Brachionichthys hirsutus TaxID=412623 RepID=UPI0036043AC4
MRVMTSSSGQEEAVTIRRSESADAQGIAGLVSPSALEAFGRVNVIQLLEKANLAVTVAGQQDEVLAHASFFDHPAGGVAGQDQWEAFLQQHFRAERCTPLNTLFLQLFVARPNFAAAGVKEIMRTVFNTLTELEFICLVIPGAGVPDPALEELFGPLQRRTRPGPACSAFSCPRGALCPRLHIRPARVEDHDDIMRVFEEQNPQEPFGAVEPGFLQLIETQDEERHAAVCESDGVAVGFISVSTDVDVKLLQDFELRELDGLYKPVEDDQTAAEPGPEEGGGVQRCDSQQQDTQPPGLEWDGSNAFCIHFILTDKKHETRSIDFIPYLFRLFPDRDFCFISVPPLSLEFPFLQSFFRAPPRLALSAPPCQLYIVHRSVLSSRVEVRPAVAADRPGVSELVTRLRLKESLLQDLDRFYGTRRDPDGVPVQAFVVQVDSQVVGLLILRDEQDVDFLRAHYNLENFIYFSHHRYEEHAQILLFILQPSFQHFSKHLFKEVLRLAHKSCLYHRGYPAHHSHQNSFIHHLDFVLHCAVPVRPRRQIIYPLEELGINAPPRRITEQQAQFALSLISRKLTLEPKVTINARIVVVGASDTGLSFLEVLCFCPHLRFNNLTLISTHGFPSDGNQEEAGFLSTSHAYSSRVLAQLPLLFRINVVTGKMVAIDRKSKHVLVSGGGKVAYDHLILCTGLQYQVPCPPGAVLSRSGSRPAPSNLLTLNDLHDCTAARRWLRDNFTELEENAIVYGNGVDVFTSVETLLGLGIQGRRIHLVLTPLQPSVFHLGDAAIETALAAALEKVGVQVHQNCLLTQMNDGEEDPDPLTAVSFSTDSEPVRLRCGVFLNLSNRGVDHDAFRSISGCFLVFDNRLVVDASFHTCDDAILGAGPLTKFSRYYHADEWSHANFSSTEVGQELAAMFLSLLDPSQAPVGRPSPGEDRLIPLYTQAKVQGGKLPGGLNYLHVSKPAATNQTPRVNELSHRVFVTGRVETGNYFSLHLDHYELVEELTCLSVKPLPVSNYLSLYGKHQQLLGQLSSCYHQGLIQDLYSFFGRSCFLAVYLDRFCDLEEELQQITSSEVTDEATSILRQDRFKEAETRAALRGSAVKYLSYNRNLLPMFANPVQL